MGYIFNPFTGNLDYYQPVNFSLDTLHLLKASNLSDLADAATARTNLGLGSIATQASSSVAITGGSITGLAGLGNNAVPGRTEARFKGPSTVIAIPTITVTAGSSSGTFSSAYVVKKGDYIWIGGISRGRVVSADSSGTSVTFTSAFDQSGTTQSFTVYPAIAMFENDSGTLQGIFEGRTGGFSVTRISINNTYSDESSLPFIVGSGTTLYSANTNGQQFHTMITFGNGTITFGTGFGMGNQAITDLNNIAGVSNSDFSVRSVGSGKLLLNSSSGANVVIRAGGSANEWEFSQTALTIADANDIAVGTTTGTKIGTATTQKIGLWNVTPVIQPATTGTTVGYTKNGASGNNVFDDSTFTGNTGSAAYTIGDIVLALKQLGALAA